MVQDNLIKKLIKLEVYLKYKTNGRIMNNISVKCYRDEMTTRNKGYSDFLSIEIRGQR